MAHGSCWFKDSVSETKGPPAETSFLRKAAYRGKGSREYFFKGEMNNSFFGDGINPERGKILM